MLDDTGIQLCTCVLHWPRYRHGQGAGCHSPCLPAGVKHIGAGTVGGGGGGGGGTGEHVTLHVLLRALCPNERWNVRRLLSILTSLCRHWPLRAVDMQL